MDQAKLKRMQEQVRIGMFSLNSNDHSPLTHFAGYDYLSTDLDMVDLFELESYTDYVLTEVKEHQEGRSRRSTRAPLAMTRSCSRH